MYWSEALRAMMALPGERGTPGLITANVGGAVRSGELRGAYSKRVAVRTDKHCRSACRVSKWRAPACEVGAVKLVL